MTEETQEGGFKPLKLTWLKSANPSEETVAKADAPSVPSAAAPAVSPVSELSASEKIPAGLTLLTFKKGVAVKSAQASESAPASVVAPAEPVRATPSPEEPVRLSPPAAVSAPPVLRPFTFATNMPSAASDSRTEAGDVSARSISAGVSFAKASESGLESVPVVESKRYLEESKAGVRPLHLAKPAEGMRVGVLPDNTTLPAPMVALTPSEAKAAPVAAAPARSAVAKPSLKPLILLLGGGALVLAALGCFLITQWESEALPVVTAPPGPVAVRSTPVPSSAPVAATEGAVMTGGGADSAPIETADPIPVSSDKNAEIDGWLEQAAVTFVASKRMTMEGRVYSLGAVVYPVGALRWIGRDSQSGDLLFMDENKVIYTKSMMMRPLP